MHFKRSFESSQLCNTVGYSTEEEGLTTGQVKTFPSSAAAPRDRTAMTSPSSPPSSPVRLRRRSGSPLSGGCVRRLSKNDPADHLEPVGDSAFPSSRSPPSISPVLSGPPSPPSGDLPKIPAQIRRHASSPCFRDQCSQRRRSNSCPSSPPRSDAVKVKDVAGASQHHDRHLLSLPEHQSICRDAHQSMVTYPCMRLDVCMTNVTPCSQTLEMLIQVPPGCDGGDVQEVSEGPESGVNSGSAGSHPIFLSISSPPAAEMQPLPSSDRDFSSVVSCPPRLSIARRIGRFRIVSAIPSSDITADEGFVASMQTMPASKPEGFAEVEADMPPPRPPTAPSRPSVASTEISGSGSGVSRFRVSAVTNSREGLSELPPPPSLLPPPPPPPLPPRDSSRFRIIPVPPPEEAASTMGSFTGSLSSKQSGGRLTPPVPPSGTGRFRIIPQPAAALPSSGPSAEEEAQELKPPSPSLRRQNSAGRFRIVHGPVPSGEGTDSATGTLPAAGRLSPPVPPPIGDVLMDENNGNTLEHKPPSPSFRRHNSTGRFRIVSGPVPPGEATECTTGVLPPTGRISPPASPPTVDGPRVDGDGTQEQKPSPPPLRRQNSIGRFRIVQGPMPGGEFSGCTAGDAPVPKAVATSSRFRIVSAPTHAPPALEEDDVDCRDAPGSRDPSLAGYEQGQEQPLLPRGTDPVRGGSSPVPSPTPVPASAPMHVPAPAADSAVCTVGSSPVPKLVSMGPTTMNSTASLTLPSKSSPPGLPPKPPVGQRVRPDTSSLPPPVATRRHRPADALEVSLHSLPSRTNRTSARRGRFVLRPTGLPTDLSSDEERAQAGASSLYPSYDLAGRGGGCCVGEGNSPMTSMTIDQMRDPLVDPLSDGCTEEAEVGRGSMDTGKMVYCTDEVEVRRDSMDSDKVLYCLDQIRRECEAGENSNCRLRTEVNQLRQMKRDLELSLFKERQLRLAEQTIRHAAEAELMVLRAQLQTYSMAQLNSVAPVASPATEGVPVSVDFSTPPQVAVPAVVLSSADHRILEAATTAAPEPPSTFARPCSRAPSHVSSTRYSREPAPLQIYVQGGTGEFFPVRSDGNLVQMARAPERGYSGDLDDIYVYDCGYPRNELRGERIDNFSQEDGGHPENHSSRDLDFSDVRTVPR